MSSKYAKKRKSGVDDDTSFEGVEAKARRDAERDGSESPPPRKAKYGPFSALPTLS